MGTVWVEYEEAAHGDLPRICMRCGEEATVTRTKTMTWYPGWVNILILFGVLIWLIVAMVMTKKMKLKAPFCDRHKGHWFYFNLFVTLGLLLHFGLLVVGLVLVSNNDPSTNDLGRYLLIGTGILFLLFIIAAAIWQITLIRPLEITADDMKLRGVCEEFRLALREQRREDREDDRQRPSRRKQPVYDDDDDA